MTETNKLKELAEACGNLNWRFLQESWTEYAIRDDHAYIATMLVRSAKQQGPCPEREAKAKFLGAMTPATVLELIAEVERLRGEVETYEEGMRSLACNLGAGGYNADTLTAAQLVDKVQWGVDNLAETQSRLLDEVRAENTVLSKTAERYRELRKITPHRFKKLQEAATTDGGDVFYFHADRFDAALDAALGGGRI